jgi:hypothetical protein
MTEEVVITIWVIAILSWLSVCVFIPTYLHRINRKLGSLETLLKEQNENIPKRK